MTDITDLADDLETLRRALAEMAKWKAVADAAKEKIQNRLGDSESGTIDGHEAVTWKHGGSNRVDTDKLKIMLGKHFQSVTKWVPSRTFLVKDD